jgi:hypothetical protein
MRLVNTIAPFNGDLLREQVLDDIQDHRCEQLEVDN